MSKVHEIQNAIEGLYADGYRDAMRDLLVFIESKISLETGWNDGADDEPEVKPTPKTDPEEEETGEEDSFRWRAAQEPTPEEPEEPAPVGNGTPTLTPGLRKVLDHLRTRTGGITSRQMRVECGGAAGALYRLTELGLAEKRGKHFYPVEAGHG